MYMYVPSHVVSGSDYVAMTNQRLTFSEAARRLCFNTTIMNDGNCEQFEFFIVSLSSPAQKVVVSPSTGYVIIHDPPLCSEWIGSLSSVCVHVLGDLNTIFNSQAVSSLASCGSLIYREFNTISISWAVSSLAGCGSLIYRDFNTISISRAVSSRGSCGSLIHNHVSFLIESVWSLCAL